MSDSAVHADHLGKAEVLCALVDDRVHDESSLSGVAVPDDELTLAAADGRESVHDLDPRLQGDFHGSTLGHPRSDELQRHRRIVGNGQGSSVQRSAERIDDPAEKIIGNAEGEERSRGLQLHAFRHVGILGEKEHPCEVFVQAHDEAEPAVFELNELAISRAGKAVRTHNAVPHGDHMADIGHCRTHFRGLELLLYLPDKVFCFHAFPISSSNSLR